MTSVNLIAFDNGAGLSRDLDLLADALRAGGLEVAVTRLNGDRRGRGGPDLRTRLPRWFARLSGRPLRRFDVNIMLERIRPLFLRDARTNLLLANPDWFKPNDARHFAALDGVLVKTRHAEPIFAELGKPAAFLGFTAPDRLAREVPRERAFFHLAGRSPYKGTQALFELWLRHPEWPRLSVLQHARKVRNPVRAPNIEHRIGRVGDAELRRLQNAHLFHLCPSETEGFGHYLVEAMSVGALAITTDAPPMNELVAPERGVLVPWSASRRERLATLYRFDTAAMEAAIARVLAMDETQCAAFGACARAWFEANDRAFRERAAGVVRAFVRPA